MERYAMQALKSWKGKQDRKPLIIRGARQVGKTWLMKEFGKNEYAQTVYINFEDSKFLKTLFVDNFDIQRIVTALQIETGVRIERLQHSQRGLDQSFDLASVEVDAVALGVPGAA